MTWNPDAAASPDSGIFGLNNTADDAQIVLIPVPFDATTSYGRRAAAGPAAILEASHQVDLYDRETGRPWQAGIHMLPEAEEVKAWNAEGGALADAIRDGAPDERGPKLARVDALSGQVNDWVYTQAKHWLERGKTVGLVGGDHATPFGLIKATVEKYPDVGILHIDAHADLRQAYEGFADSHASIMFNVLQRTSLKKLVQVGIRDFGESELAMIEASPNRIKTFFDIDIANQQLAGTSFVQLCDSIVSELPKQVYVSFDIDGLDPTLCPNTGTPVPGGLSFREVAVLLASIGRSGRTLVGFDLNEVAPGDDGSEWDGNVGARVLYKLCGHAARS